MNEIISYSSFSNNYVHTSQVGYIVLIYDRKKEHIIHYSSNKSLRDTISVLGGEFYALANFFDYSYTQNNEI